MIRFPTGSILSVLLGVTPVTASAQNFVDLDFSHHVQPTNGVNPNNSTLGPAYYAGLTLDFVNVAFVDELAVDARVTINFETSPGVSPGYEFVGYIPDYNSASDGPEGDLGVYYRSKLDNLTQVTGGISYTISFYESGSNFTTAKTLTDFRFLIYDHDGEPGQSESIRTYAADGFVGYQLGGISGIHAHDEGGAWSFDARGSNHPEDNADGSFIAYYQNSSSVTFDLYATTETWLPGANNGIFAAFDGDLSLIGGNTLGFDPRVNIPEPASVMVTSVATLLALLRRQRPRVGTGTNAH